MPRGGVLPGWRGGGRAVQPGDRRAERGHEDVRAVQGGLVPCTVLVDSGSAHRQGRAARPRCACAPTPHRRVLSPLLQCAAATTLNAPAPTCSQARVLFSLTVVSFLLLYVAGYDLLDYGEEGLKAGQPCLPRLPQHPFSPLLSHLRPHLCLTPAFTPVITPVFNTCVHACVAPVFTPMRAWLPHACQAASHATSCALYAASSASAAPNPASSAS